MPATRTSKRMNSKKASPVEESPEAPQQTGEGPSKLMEVTTEAATNVAEVTTNIAGAAEEFIDKMTGIEGNGKEPTGREEEEEEDSSDAKTPNAAEVPKMTMEERKARMEKLRKKIVASERANRTSMIEENAKSKITARDAARLEKQRKLAEVLRAKADAEEKGEDVERGKNWEWTIEENDTWEKKLARKARRADFEFHDDAHAARRRYKKDLDHIKPDLVAYNKQKEIAMGLAPGSLVAFDPTRSSVMDLVPTSQQQQLAAENLYRDANTLIYGDSKPSEDAIDRVVSKINQDIDKKGKFSRKRLNEEEGDITYINEHNRVFNKKIARYYDKYTAEIRASFERGTAL